MADFRIDGLVDGDVLRVILIVRYMETSVVSVSI